MGDDAVIVRGTVGASERRADAAARAMYSTVHGAGRVMSRTAAAGKVNRRNGKVIRPGAVSPEMMTSWVREKGVILRGGGLDESPHAYRRLPDVLAAQKGTIESAPHAPPAHRRDGGSGYVRSVQGLKTVKCQWSARPVH